MEYARDGIELREMLYRLPKVVATPWGTGYMPPMCSTIKIAVFPMTSIVKLVTSPLSTNFTHSVVRTFVRPFPPGPASPSRAFHSIHLVREGESIIIVPWHVNMFSPVVCVLHRLAFTCLDSIHIDHSLIKSNRRTEEPSQAKMEPYAGFVDLDGMSFQVDEYGFPVNGFGLPVDEPTLPVDDNHPEM